ncbi:hypothetical protein BOTCAL_0013g00480 [Botryotinia calthae]|uniref:Heterokaryon incompatibility domain-containing protein n=1 Tax=Botryotinia calthae TaxID=38488 RepID=A0A4Y8DIR2_9HELO|nr:hypothetical protein BOTCAL_0013g00480 [Botryotinia calthae]
MRLLSRSRNGKWLVQEFFKTVPFYAILSHTWDSKDAEVTFEDIKDGTRDFDDRSKPGFDKLRFCCEKAEIDGLSYFCIDTCCIKKSDSAELDRSLNSMFYWYRTAVRCYVLLSDVSARIPSGGENFNAVEAFKRSRWFERGWTLQELIAPSSVVFYSKEGSRLGDKQELVEAVATVTKIPVMALQGVELSRFSKKERFSWAHNRKTSVPQDAAYCLLGIFNVRMYPSYAEGVASDLKKEALYQLDRIIEDTSQNAKHGDDVIRIGGASWCDLSRLDQTKLGELDRELESYVRWLLDIFPSEQIVTENLTKLSQTAGKKMKALLADFEVQYEDLSSMETTVKTWEEPWARYNDKSKPDQIRVQALVENRWYWTKRNEEVFKMITAARTLMELMTWRGIWTDQRSNDIRRWL